MDKRSVWHFAIASALTFFGIILLFFGAIVKPQGVIDSSILIAFGEVATFAGALMGIDWKYRNRK